jgi:predicted nucleotidyltransferase
MVDLKRVRQIGIMTQAQILTTMKKPPLPADDVAHFGLDLAHASGRFTPADFQLFDFLIEAAQQLYGERLQAIKLVGSRARGTARPDSDYDFLIFLDQCDYEIEVPALHKMGDELTAKTKLGPLSISPMSREQFVGLDKKFDDICASFIQDAVVLW